MRVIICGCRSHMTMDDLLCGIEDSGFFITKIIQGGCPDPKNLEDGRSVDMLAKEYADTVGIPQHQEDALWDLYGRRAGPIRNEKMATMGESVLAIWDNLSEGTKGMIEIGRASGLRTQVYVPKRYRSTQKPSKD